jgi:hypothetical protein
MHTLKGVVPICYNSLRSPFNISSSEPFSLIGLQHSHPTRKRRDMAAVLQFQETGSCIGLSTRKAKPGPERDLVQRFTDYMIATYEPKTSALGFFYEPSLASGFPDMVIVEYDPHVFEYWPHSRFSLRPTDLKVLHHIHHVKGADSEDIQMLLGMQTKSLLQTLERLVDAGLIIKHSHEWIPVCLKRVFGIKRLIAIEAKMHNLANALQQAAANKWFASETYIVSPVQEPTVKLLHQSEIFGTGIYSCNRNGIHLLRSSLQMPLPSSYASWLFNEWVGRQIHLSDTGKGNYARHSSNCKEFSGS